jgi:ABC-type enterobactin transport system permease subunit
MPKKITNSQIQNQDLDEKLLQHNYLVGSAHPTKLELSKSVPHLCRGLLRTADLRWLFPSAILVGGSFALVADIIAQMPGGRSVLPINSVTSLIGTPIIAWIILHQQRNSHS